MLVRHEAIEDALQSEISHHIECETTDLIRRCTPPDLARRQTLLAALAGVRLADVDVDRSTRVARHHHRDPDADRPRHSTRSAVRAARTLSRLERDHSNSVCYEPLVSARSLSTVFQLRPVPRVFKCFSMRALVRRDWPTPSG